MIVDKVVEDLKTQLSEGFVKHKFEAYARTYLISLEELHDDVTKTLYYFDETNSIVRMYIRTDTDTYNINFDINDPLKIETAIFDRNVVYK